MAEVELKLEVDRGARAPLMRAAALAGTKPRRVRMASLYFDTPECALAGAGMALRLRRSGRRWTQCLKAGRSGTGGLHAREEWEFERPGPVLDLSLFAQTPLAALEGAASLHRTLAKVFTVEFQRTSWQVEPASGCRLEVALDCGFVESRGRREEISEVEIECMAGDPAHAFGLARHLLEEVALRPSATAKAARGYRLLNRCALRPVKASPVRLDEGMGPLPAARALVAAALGQLQANEEGVLRAAAPEFVHQARVALRRLRSALRLFPAAIGDERAKAWRAEWSESTRALGAARDWDVFATESLPALAASYGDPSIARALMRRAALRRRQCREDARSALRSPRHARAVLDLASWLAGIGEETADGPTEPLADFASRWIRKRRKSLLAGLEGLARMPAEERHRLRIEAKRLRYGVEGLASVFHSGKERRFTRRLADLQEALGRANDAATGARLLAELDPPDAFAAFARGWLAARMVPDPALIASLAARLEKSPRFWRRKSASDPPSI
jgi:triphosphatase